MKKLRIGAAILALLALLSGCAVPFFEKPQEHSGSKAVSHDIPQGFGTVGVSLSQGAARTIMPAADLDMLRLEYWFARDGGAPEKISPLNDKFILKPGVYALEVKAFVDENDQASLAARGTAEGAFAIAAGVDAGTVNVTLRPAATGEGEGSLAFSLQYPAGITVETLSLTLIAGGGAPIDLNDPPLNPVGSGPLVLSGVRHSIPVGCYLFRATLKNAGGIYAGKTEVAHIYRNLTARTDPAGYEFTEESFRIARVTTVNDSGEGSLRQAIAAVNSLGPRIIWADLPPGSVIELESPLPGINNSLVLEGNGLALTPAASWTSAASPIQAWGNYDVTIRRLHFKNFRAFQGGAISFSTGNLTVESCVFSGNRAEVNAGSQGGAIYGYSANLAVRGCAFYENSASTGGAVYFYGSGKTLALTGNLFYGNAASTGYPAAYCPSGTVSASYNLTDIGFGTGSAQCGWQRGTGDLQSSGLPISGRTFKPLSGSQALDKIAVRPPGYPATDFYGAAVPLSNAAIGAAQTPVAGTGYYLELSQNNSQGGTVTVSPPLDHDGLFSAGSSVTAEPEISTGHVLEYFLVNGVKNTGNPLALPSAHAWVQAVFSRNVKVDVLTDANAPGTLRHALANAREGDIISFDGVTAGETIIELNSVLPSISTSITIEGKGVILAAGPSWNSGGSALLSVNNANVEAAISRVCFKNFVSGSSGGGAISARGKLSLESCVFSGNRSVSGHGGAIFSDNDLALRGCAFYENSALSGGAVYFSGSGKALSLRGNLFYGNAAAAFPAVEQYGALVNASYNLTDADFGTEAAQCGWAQGTGDVKSSGLPISGKTFKPLPGSQALGRIAERPPDYPAADFYGDPVPSSNAAIGAAQTPAAGTGNYLELSQNKSWGGTLTVSPPLDGDGLFSTGASVTAEPEISTGYVLEYFLVNGVKNTDNPLVLPSAHAWVQAVFARNITVNSLADDGAAGTLRHALTGAQDGDIISLSGVTAGASFIELGSPLPPISASITIEGNGITLTRAASWTPGDTSQLLYINNRDAELTIRRTHFKNGLSARYGGAIRNDGKLILESCVFSGNKSGGNIHGGAVYSSNELVVRGCLFYRNRSTNYGGAIGCDGNLTLTGNLFYENTAESMRPVVEAGDGAAVSASYNLTDIGFGTGAAQCGWEQGAGDLYAEGVQISAKTFRPLYGSAALGKIPGLPDYPAKDFYGIDIPSSNAAIGAAQTAAASGYYLDLSENNSQAGTVTIAPPLDADGIAANNFTLSLSPASSYSFAYFLVNGVKTTTAPISLSGHSVIQAVFVLPLTSSADSGPGTLREALANARDGDFISIPSTVSPIELASALPEINTSITIEGQGVVLTRAASWAAVDTTSRLLSISSADAEVRISGIHFKNGRVASSGSFYDGGGAIRNRGILTVESCVFSNNSASSSYGGAIFSDNTLAVRGCTFYRNTASYGQALYLTADGKHFTLTGNLFYNNSNGDNHIPAYIRGDIKASYNAADLAHSQSISGWADRDGGTGNVKLFELGIDGDPFNTSTFAPVSELNHILPSPAPTDFPIYDFHGNTRTFPGAPGAVSQ